MVVRHPEGGLRSASRGGVEGPAVRREQPSVGVQGEVRVRMGRPERAVTTQVALVPARDAIDVHLALCGGEVEAPGGVATALVGREGDGGAARRVDLERADARFCGIVHGQNR